MRGRLSLLGGIGLGAGLMYFADPHLGRRRRAAIRDQITHLFSRADDALRCAARDVVGRGYGLAARARSLLTPQEIDDGVLVERVRSHLGRVVSHPKSLQVTARDGTVSLTGPILAHEVDRLIECVRSVPGVCEVENALEMHKERGNISGL